MSHQEHISVNYQPHSEAIPVNYGGHQDTTIDSEHSISRLPGMTPDVDDGVVRQITSAPSSIAKRNNQSSHITDTGEIDIMQPRGLDRPNEVAVHGLRHWVHDKLAPKREGAPQSADEVVQGSRSHDRLLPAFYASPNQSERANAMNKRKADEIAKALKERHDIGIRLQ